MPKVMGINGRSSSITNAFVNSIIPVIYPTEQEIKKVLNVLKINPEKLECAYCGATASEWDHLRPLVKNQKPTGYISEIANLVPSCGKCNQSKGNKDWYVWILSNAKLSPKSRGIKDLTSRIERLKDYEQWGNPKKFEFEKLIEKKLWNQHWNNWESVIKMMKESQSLALKIKDNLAKNISKR